MTPDSPKGKVKKGECASSILVTCYLPSGHEGNHWNEFAEIEWGNKEQDKN